MGDRSVPTTEPVKLAQEAKKKDEMDSDDDDDEKK